jgi:hypothetical protein
MEFEIIKTVANFARSFTIGPNNIRIGVTTFSNAVHPQFNLNKYNGKSALVRAINNIPYSKITKVIVNEIF